MPKKTKYPFYILTLAALILVTNFGYIKWTTNKTNARVITAISTIHNADIYYSTKVFLDDDIYMNPEVYLLSSLLVNYQSYICTLIIYGHSNYAVVSEYKRALHWDGFTVRASYEDENIEWAHNKILECFGINMLEYQLVHVGQSIKWKAGADSNSVAKDVFPSNPVAVEWKDNNTTYGDISYESDQIKLHVNLLTGEFDTTYEGGNKYDGQTRYVSDYLPYGVSNVYFTITIDNDKSIVFYVLAIFNKQIGNKVGAIVNTKNDNVIYFIPPVDAFREYYLISLSKKGYLMRDGLGASVWVVPY